MKTSRGWLALAAALWVPVWVPLSGWWRSDMAHLHGWAVPVFAVWLAARRWRDRPAMQLPESRERLAAGMVTAGLLAAWGMALLLLVPNALWPTAQWAATLAAAGVWLSVAWSEGGRKWAGHFGPAVLFTLCAVAWPTIVQTTLFETLGPVIARVAAEVVNLGGRLAVARGAVIEVTGGLVGVDEACAGLRSMEAAVMMAWFLGEYRRMGMRARLGLLSAALGLALAGNVARAAWLVWAAAGDPRNGVQTWHDIAGLVAMGATLAAIPAVSEWFQGRPCNQKTTTAVTGSRQAGRVALAVLAVALAANGWYASGPGGSGAKTWRLRAAPDGWREGPAPAGAFTLLEVSRAETLEGGGPGWRGEAHLLAWEGDVAWQEVAFQHGPEVCLPAIGAKREAELGEQRVEISGHEVPWRWERYVTTAGRRQYVWLVRWDGWVEAPLAEGRWAGDPTAMRLAAVRERRTQAATTTLVVAGLGFSDDEAARAWFAEWAPRLFERR
jgi:exosortase